ncbi:MAG: hypothetical protein ACLGH0_15670 [Thermoanaerobaculia bacterium]
MIALFAQAANACITVDVAPRERFHGAAVVIRATAGDLFVFHSDESWHGDVPRGAEIFAEYDPLRCGVPTIEKGKQYLIYADELPQRDEDLWILAGAQFVSMDNAQRDIEFLEKRGANAITLRELGRVLDDWKNGRISHDALRTWLHEASTRDVADWVDTPDAGLVSRIGALAELLSRLLRPAEVSEPPESGDCLATIVHSHADDLLRLLRSRDRSGERFVNDLEQLESVIAEKLDVVGC